MTTYADVLADRRDAPLTSALVDPGLRGGRRCCCLLAVLGVALGSGRRRPGPRRLGRGGCALARPGVAASCGGCSPGSWLAPVAASVLIGVGLGTACAFAVFGSLGLEQVTGQDEPPQVVIPWWTAVAAVLLLATALAVAWRETRELRRSSLARLLRAGGTAS